MPLAQSNIVAFAATALPEQAKAFYSGVLGLTEIADTPFALVFDANGTTLRIQKVEKVAPPEFTTLGWEVGDIAEMVAQLTAKGVQLERYAALPQDDRGIWETPDGAMIAWFKDPDGNTLYVTQSPARE